MKKTTLHFYTDPGHGWLKVPKNHPAFRVIASRISDYSYERGNFVYLEEDCDASLFLQVLHNCKIELVVHSHHSDRRSRIRGYNRFYYTFAMSHSNYSEN